MSTATLTGADAVFVGRGSHPATVNLLGRKGVPVQMLTMADLGTPALGDADLFVVAATGTELPVGGALTKAYTWATDGTSPLDNAAAAAPVTRRMADGDSALVVDVDALAPYGRNLSFVASSAGTTVAMTVTVAGFDYLGQAMSELFTLAATETSVTAAGAKAFKWIKSITVVAAAAATGTTLNGGTGAKLGLPFKLASLGHVFKASIGGVQELINVASNATVVAADTTTATNATGDVRGTIAFNTALDGSKACVAWYHVAGHASGAGIAGVAQA